MGIELSHHRAGARPSRWNLSQWLLGFGCDMPASVRRALLGSIYGSLAINIAGVLNVMLVSAVLAWRLGSTAVYICAAVEFLVATARFIVLVACYRAMRERRDGPLELYLQMTLLWACSIGAAAFIAVMSGDWVAAIVACVSGAALLGAICFRYFAAPRFVCAMLLAVGLPGAAACILSGEGVLIFSGLQIPLYIVVMTAAACQMRHMMERALHAERDQAHQARHDPLTGLLNRTGMVDALSERVSGEPLACFFIDLDGFKRVNDSMGHQAGDQLLAMVAERLRMASRPEDILVRLGGDEFLVVSHCSEPEVARLRGASLASALAGLPYIVDSQGVFIGASVGAALRGHGDSLEEWIAAADEALYQAKGSCASCVVAGEEPPRVPMHEPTPLRVAHG